MSPDQARAESKGSASRLLGAEGSIVCGSCICIDESRGASDAMYGEASEEVLGYVDVVRTVNVVDRTPSIPGSGRERLRTVTRVSRRATADDH